MALRFLVAALLVAVSAAPAVAAPAPAARAAARPAAATDWASRVAVTPEGGILVGNPAAAVKLIEFGSLTCPHCRAFHEAGLPALKAGWLAQGRLSYEYRPFSLNGIDLMAGLVMQCLPAAEAWAFVDRVYARQEELVRPFLAVPPAEQARIQALPPGQQGAAMAQAGRLPEFVAAAGVPRARYDACIAADAGMEKLLAIRADAVQTHGLTGTPSFLINGRMQANVFDWPALEPLLAAAIKAAPQSAPAARTK